MQKLIIATLLASLYYSGFSQKKGPGNGIAFTLSPAILNLEDLTVGVQPGIKYGINRSWAVSTEVVLRTVRHSTPDFRQSHYFRAALETKYFFKFRAKDIKPYLSGQVAVALRNWKDENSGAYRKRKDTLWYNYQSAVIKSPVFTIAGKFGAEVFIVKRWALDGFIGLGVRLVATRYQAENVFTTPIVRQRETGGPMKIGPDPAYWFNQNTIRLHFTTGLRIQYYLWKE
jgi:hypothetical protein